MRCHPPCLGLLVLLFGSSVIPLEAADRPEGFGAGSRGGAGGQSVVVTTLADDGPGSLRAALALKKPRIVTFAVAGPISLKRPIIVRHGRVTVDGSTAPREGVTVSNHGIWFLDDSSDIILRHLRVRATTGGANGDGLLFNGTNRRVLIDHCSLMWATDENLDTWGRVQDLTCQWTLIAEGQVYGDHAKGRHSMGWLCGRANTRFTVHHCLFAHNGDRNPLLSGGTFDLVNNVIYNWSGGSNAVKLTGGARANVIGSTIIAGAESGGGGVIWLHTNPAGSRVYVEDNITPFTRTGQENPFRAVQAGSTFPAGILYQAARPFPAPPVIRQRAAKAYELVLRKVGPKVRDADERRVIEEVRKRTGHAGRRNEIVDPGDRLGPARKTPTDRTPGTK